ncbi:class I SAM-dependent methyltransferase [Streptomyces sp. DSM 42041]|uniref:Class I SAM-dependent methyltransferase n=1 Tax=Streptomyces hazeniae TaxID=3075538 RepID=A0ABU2NNH4_9ACTN|nr:class I SAM-dependent methyltransferase [Streptomyces sp. DSM 42041]MDT0378523.1 class I SAM-dependent methyltransferase [Streptomyces sp. DSM 42041]
MTTHPAHGPAHGPARDRRPAGVAPAGVPPPWRNAEADWDRWPVGDYLAENYREIHDADAAVLRHHAAVYRRIPPGSVALSLELGCGPNLYPLMQAAAVSRRIDALEPGAAARAYLARQLAGLQDSSWQEFYALCRSLDPALPGTLTEALSRVRLVPGGAAAVRAGAYGLASMHFVAESVTEDGDEFAALCRAFVHAVCPGGQLLAAFMENMPTYRIGVDSRWPAFPADADTVRAVFAPLTEDLRLTRVAKDAGLPDYGDTGMLLLHARRAR